MDGLHTEFIFCRLFWAKTNSVRQGRRIIQSCHIDHNLAEHGLLLIICNSKTGKPAETQLRLSGENLTEKGGMGEGGGGGADRVAVAHAQ